MRKVMYVLAVVALLVAAGCECPIVQAIVEQLRG